MAFPNGAVKDPGYLHRATHTPMGQDIPKSKIQADANQTKNPHLKRAAELAEDFAHMDHSHKKDHKFGAPKG